MSASAPTDLYPELEALFIEHLRVEVPSPETDLLQTGRLDSLGVVELLFRLEQRFGIRIDTDDLEVEYFRSLAAIAAFVTARRRNGDSPMPSVASGQQAVLGEPGSTPS
ncbi:MAG TPA: acyl carrier protein [Gemmatimonadales bacterium]|nr:acyl carrier protein [Gemmatimonadales bacterium]